MKEQTEGETKPEKSMSEEQDWCVQLNWRVQLNPKEHLKQALESIALWYLQKYTHLDTKHMQEMGEPGELSTHLRKSTLHLLLHGSIVLLDIS